MNSPTFEPTTQDLIDGLDVVSFYAAMVPGFKANGQVNVKVRCPFGCGDDKSFSVDQETGLYLCHRCGAKGSPWGFLEAQHQGPAQIRSTLLDYQRNGTTRTLVNIPREAKTEKPALGPIVKTYDYYDEKGELLFQVTRHDPKDFRQRQPDGFGGWINKIVGVRRVLYGLPGLIEAVKAGWTIYVCEGEKDADRINGLESGGEFYATTAPMGAGAKWSPEFSPFLAGADVVIVAHRDEPGRRRALDVRFHLKDAARSVRIVHAKTGKDAFDHLEAGHALADFVPMTEPGEPDAKPAGSSDLPYPADLYSAIYTPRRPDFDVKSFMRKRGLVLAWSAPGGLKTHSTMVLVHEMLCTTVGRLFGHPDLWINRHWKRVLWIATEESGDELRYQAEQVLKGLGKEKLDGELHYLFASTAGKRVTLDDLEELIKRYGPWDAIVLDSLTGLRPKVVNGVSVKWDLDNDAGNEMCLKLRGLAEEHGVCFLILHHSGRDTTRYRGGVDWWASADTMFGLVPDNGMVKIQVEKVRGGKKPASFTIEPEWHADGSFTARYAATAAPVVLTTMGEKVRVFYQAAKTASQAEMVKAIGCARSTGQTAIEALLLGKYIQLTGSKDRSPVYSYIEVPEVTDEVTGNGKKKEQGNADTF